MSDMQRQIDDLYDQLDKLGRKISQRQTAPTIPKYDSGNFPQDPVEGQIAVGTGTDNDLWYYVDGQWRPAIGIRTRIGARVVCASATSPYLTPFSPTLAHFTSTDYSNDITVHIGAPSDYIEITVPGIYIVCANFLFLSNTGIITADSAILSAVGYNASPAYSGFAQVGFDQRIVGTADANNGFENGNAASAIVVREMATGDRINMVGIYSGIDTNIYYNGFLSVHYLSA